MGYRLAVDLGTAFAAAAVIDGAGPTMVGLGNRTLQVPSVLFFPADHSTVVGEAAERRGSVEPARLVREFKRRFGDPVPLVVAGSAYSAESLMARLLRWVVDTTTDRQGEAPAELMLTHPANWGPYKRELLDQVVTLAGQRSACYCTEPEAAAVNYAARAKVHIGDRIAVYDLGGGTFDVCVLEKRAGGFVLLGTPGGIEHLGGADVDEVMTQLVLRNLPPHPEFDPDDPTTTMRLARLRRECVDAKEALSADADVVVPVALPGLNAAVRVNRSELETSIRPSLQDTLTAFWRTLGSANVQPQDLATVVMVGGSSRIPLVGEMLQGEFGLPLSIDTHPKHDIALGAALLSRDRSESAAYPPPRAPAPAASAVAVTAPLERAPEPVTTASVDRDGERSPAHRAASPSLRTESTAGAGDPDHRPRSRRPILLALAAVMVLVAVLVLALRWPFGDGRSPSSSESIGPTVEVTGTPTTEELLSHVPGDYRSSCSPTGSDLRSAAVKLVCPITGSGVTSVTHYQYDSAATYDRAVADVFTSPRDSDCREGSGQGPYTARSPTGRPRSGLLMCDAGSSVITFVASTDQLRVITVAQAGYDSDFGYPEMHGSWEIYPME